MSNNLILLSGPVGAGKTTVCRALIATAMGPVGAIEGDTFFKHLVKMDESGASHKDFRVIMRAMVAAAIAYAASGYEAILDFSIPPWFLPTVRKMIGTREVVLHYIILRPSEAVCAARAREREEGAVADYERYREFYTLFGEMPQHEVQNDQIAPATVAKQIREALIGGTFLVPQSQ